MAKGSMFTLPYQSPQEAKLAVMLAYTGFFSGVPLAGLMAISSLPISNSSCTFISLNPPVSTSRNVPSLGTPNVVARRKRVL